MVNFFDFPSLLLFVASSDVSMNSHVTPKRNAFDLLRADRCSYLERREKRRDTDKQVMIYNNILIPILKNNNCCFWKRQHDDSHSKAASDSLLVLANVLYNVDPFLEKICLAAGKRLTRILVSSGLFPRDFVAKYKTEHHVKNVLKHKWDTRLYVEKLTEWRDKIISVIPKFFWVRRDATEDVCSMFIFDILLKFILFSIRKDGVGSGGCWSHLLLQLIQPCR